MSRRYQHKNTDKNEKEIVKALRQINGVTVETDKDDIIVGYKKRSYWFEIKNPNEIKKNGDPFKRKGKTYEKQMKLKKEFTGHYSIVSNIDQILAEIMV
jgi:hypothetical protein